MTKVTKKFDHWQQLLGVLGYPQAKKKWGHALTREIFSEAVTRVMARQDRAIKTEALTKAVLADLEDHFTDKQGKTDHPRHHGK